jgi:hypothetical protein
MSLESASQYHDYLFSDASVNATETQDIDRQKTGTGAVTWLHITDLNNG